ncbi:hypothetical protein WA158_003693 [Blastocystis sp. Blastoise]
MLQNYTLYRIELCFNQKLTPRKFRGVEATNYRTKVTILPIIPRIRFLLSSKRLIRDISYYTKEEIISILQNESVSLNQIPLFMTGINFKKSINDIINKGDIFLVFSMTCDGISPFSDPVSDENLSSFPILIKLLNYKEIREADHRKFWTYSVTKESFSSSIFDILVEEFKILYKGIEMDVCINDRIEKKTVIGLLLHTYGDCAAITKVANFTGSSSLYPCRCCELRWCRKQKHFHQGIKCTYKEVKKYVHTNNTKKSVTSINYPSAVLLNNKSTPYSILPQMKDYHTSNDTIIERLPRKDSFKDSLKLVEYPLRTKISIQKNRNSCSDRVSFKGMKKTPGILEKLPYFDPSTCYCIDTMHLFNNVSTLIINLLFGFNTKQYANKLSRKYFSNGEKYIKHFSLNPTNMSIIESRISSINTLYNKNEYEFRYILDEKKYYNMSSHTRIFFVSCILPLITLDFSNVDSPIILLIDPLATIIYQAFSYNGNTPSALLNIFKDQYSLFCFICELLLPREIINSQIHLMKHLPETIINSGSLIYSSTYESERFYSFLKRSTYGRKRFNESCIRVIIEKEVTDINLTDNLEDINEDNIVNDILIAEHNNDNENDFLSREDIFEGFNNIHINRGEINVVKGLRASPNIDLSESQIKEIIYILLSSPNEFVNMALLPNVDINSYINISSCLEDHSVFQTLLLNFKKIPIVFYSEVLINETKVFSSSGVDEGIERQDNSYIMYNTYDSGEEQQTHLIKALNYIQIDPFILIQKHEYPLARMSRTRLYYIINDSNRQIPRTSKYSTSFIDISNIIPENLIIVDIHNNKIMESDASYEEPSIRSKRSIIRTEFVSANSVITSTVFMPRYCRSL